MRRELMTDTRSVFGERYHEIRRIKILISRLHEDDREMVELVFGGTRPQQAALRPLFSTFALMHYSLVEAIVTVGITELVEAVSGGEEIEISDTYLEFLLQCRMKELRQLDFSLWPKNMREVLLEYKEVSKIGLSESQVRSLWAGNLDAKKIRENILGRLNLQLSGAERFRDGYDLRRIKDDRNDLAHGIKSWDVVGGNYTWPELVSISNRVLIYTVRFIKTIEVALCEKKWEAPVVASA